MDLLKLGLRSVLGVTMPGTILVLVFLYTLFSLLYALNQPLTIFAWSKDQQFLIVVVLFLVSYLLGSLMRLNAADTVDKKSADSYLKKHRKDEAKKEEAVLTEADFKKKLEELEKGPISFEIFEKLSVGFDEWVWAEEDFPYPVWQFRKFYLYHPREVFNFFESYKHCMGFRPGGQGKEFFNYCKMVVFHAGRQLGDTVVEEVHFAEAIVRFYAGTYYGLQLSFWMLLGLIAIQLPFLWHFWGQPGRPLKVVSCLVTAGLIDATWRMKRTIVERFRTIRLKEVDTVYDAFYLVHRHVNNCQACQGLPASTSGSSAEIPVVLQSHGTAKIEAGPKPK